MRSGSTALPLLLTALVLATAVPVSNASDSLAADSSPSIPQATAAGTVVLCDPTDPYRALAREIADTEGLAVYDDLAEALKTRPVYLLWVAEPARLSERVMVDLAVRLERAVGNEAPAVGLISGGDLESARRLWLRRGLARGGRAAVANAGQPTWGIDRGRLFMADATGEPGALSIRTLRETLTRVDYLSFTGHAGAHYWRLDEETLFQALDVPALPPVFVVATGCSSFRPWIGRSICRAFTDRGAAGYCGFVFSPISGYLPGAFADLPFRYTWPGFPVGRVVQLLNRGTRQGFAAVDQFCLLGDPRLALAAEPPGRLVSDESDGDTRVLRWTDLPAGMIPLRIPQGAGYDFAAVPGLVAESSRSPFYNARLQMLDRGGDKYVLLRHSGGDLTLRLRRSPPPLWSGVDLVWDSLDHFLVFLPGSGTSLIAGVVGAVGLTVGLVLWRRRRPGRRVLWTSAGCGVVFGLAHLLYLLARLDAQSITTKIVTADPWAAPSTFLVATAGALLYLVARSRRGRVWGLLTASASPLLAALIGLTIVIVFDTFVFRSRYGAALYNCNMGLMNLVVWGVWAGPAWAMFWAVRRWLRREDATPVS